MQNSFWHQVPVVRLLLPFAIGIGISMFYPVALWVSTIGFIITFLLATIIQVALRQFAHRWAFGLMISICMFAGGMMLHQSQNELLSSDHFRFKPTATQLFIKLDEQPITKATSYKVRCTAIGLKDSAGLLLKASGKLIIYLRKEMDITLPKYGDVIAIPFSAVRLISPPQNPDEFNYKRYLAFNQIHHQAYVTANQLYQLGVNEGGAVMKWIFSVQQYFKSVLIRCIASSNESGVAQALLYGYDDDIDAETMQAYANTGTLHVLAVSGMHVGIIFSLLGYFLLPLNRTKRLKIIKNIIILIALWLYSLLCGFSPSILRATVMFTFIIMAAILGAKSNVYNTLAASSFVLLCMDSNILANVGFQLSYAAVFGIIFFQPFISKWYLPNTWLGHQVWGITSVSLAAQLITCPIGLLYFHQFPNCFLFSNLLIIPLTTIILYLGMVLLAVSPFSWLSWLVGQLMFYLILATNNLVKFVESIPYAYVNGIHISIFQSIILYFLLFSFTAFFLLRRTFYINAVLGLAVVFTVIESFHAVENFKQKRLVIYCINKHTAVQVFYRNQALLYADEELLANASKIKFHIQQHNWKSGINNPQKDTIGKEWKHIVLPNYAILISGSLQEPIKLPDHDMLIITHAMPELQLIKHAGKATIIISSMVKNKEALKMKELFSKWNKMVTYMGERSALEIKLP